MIDFNNSGINFDKYPLNAGLKLTSAKGQMQVDFPFE